MSTLQSLITRKVQGELDQALSSRKKKGRTLSSGILVSNPAIKKKSKKNPTIRKFSKKDESSNPVIKKNKRKVCYQEFKFWEPCHQEP